MSKEKEYVCGYKFCLHCGEKVKSSEAVMVGKKHFHWDCAATKQEITDLKDTYIARIDSNADPRIVTKVLNDLTFKYMIDFEYLKFWINDYASYGKKMKSPFSLLYIRNKNSIMEKRFEEYKRKLKKNLG